MNKMNKSTDDAVVISCQLIDRLIRDEGKDWSYLIALYIFYYNTARRQKTNCPWAVNKFVAQGLHWGERQVKERKARLISLGLIENVRRVGKDGKVAKWYVRVNFIWNQSTSTPEVQMENPTTCTFNHPVVSDRQMLEVPKGKCLKKREERRKREEDQTQTQNQTQDTNTVGVGFDSLAPAEGGSEPDGVAVGRTQEQKESPKLALANYHRANQPASFKPSLITGRESQVDTSQGSDTPIQTKDEYVAQMSLRWSQICGVDGQHILEADLASNTRIKNWGRQAQYWSTRLANTDRSSQEAWTLIARYLKRYNENNRHYPDMRLLLRGWRSSYWEAEKKRIEAFCKSNMASIMMTNYLDCRADEGRVIPVKWLLSAADYQSWFKRDGDAGSPADAWDNRPVANAQSMEEWERRHQEGLRQEREALRKKEALKLIDRARAIIRNIADDQEVKNRVVDLLKGYRDGSVRLEMLRTGIETLEKGQGAPSSADEGECRVRQPPPKK